MPEWNSYPVPTITLFRYQEEGAAKYYEIGDDETIWGMTDLANNAQHVSSSVTFKGAVSSAVAASALVLL